MPDTPSLKNRPLYEKLRRAGYSKSSAAAISNEVARRKRQRRRRLRGRVTAANRRTK
jgi:hypothetical protein